MSSTAVAATPASKKATNASKTTSSKSKKRSSSPSSAVASSDASSEPKVREPRVRVKALSRGEKKALLKSSLQDAYSSLSAPGKPTLESWKAVKSKIYIARQILRIAKASSNRAGFNTTIQVTSQMSAFLVANGCQPGNIMRADANRRISAYIKSHKTDDSRRSFRLKTDPLKFVNLLTKEGQDCYKNGQLTYFNMNKYLVNNFISKNKDDTTAAAAPDTDVSIPAAPNARKRAAPATSSDAPVATPAPAVRATVKAGGRK